MNWPRERYRMADHAHRDAKRRNRIAWERAEHGNAHPEGFGFTGEFYTVPKSPRPQCDPDRILLLRDWRKEVRSGPRGAMKYGEILQAVVSPLNKALP